MQYGEEQEAGLPCRDKLAFATREQAESIAAVNAYRYGGKLRAYKCRHCGLWHLSSRVEDETS